MQVGLILVLWLGHINRHPQICVKLTLIKIDGSVKITLLFKKKVEKVIHSKQVRLKNYFLGNLTYEIKVQKAIPTFTY